MSSPTNPTSLQDGGQTLSEPHETPRFLAHVFYYVGDTKHWDRDKFHTLDDAITWAQMYYNMCDHPLAALVFEQRHSSDGDSHKLITRWELRADASLRRCNHD